MGLLQVDAIDSTGIYLWSSNLLGRHHLPGRRGLHLCCFCAVWDHEPRKIIIFSPRPEIGILHQDENRIRSWYIYEICTCQTFRSSGACWTQLGCMLATCLWGLLDPAQGYMLATYRSYGACWMSKLSVGTKSWQRSPFCDSPSFRMAGEPPPGEKKINGFIFSNRDTFDTTKQSGPLMGFTFRMIRYK